MLILKWAFTSFVLQYSLSVIIYIHSFQIQKSYTMELLNKIIIVKVSIHLNYDSSYFFPPISAVNTLILEGNGTPLQYFCLENPHGRRSLVGCSPWGRQSRTRLSDFTFTFHFYALEKEMATHSSILAWRIPGTGRLVGCRLWGRTESDTTEATQQQQPFIVIL